MNFDKVLRLEMPIEFLPKQMKVLESIKDNEGVLYSGAFRAGKTLLLVHAAIMTCLENPGVHGMLISQAIVFASSTSTFVASTSGSPVIINFTPAPGPWKSSPVTEISNKSCPW